MHLAKLIFFYNEWHVLPPEHIEGSILEKAANASEYIKQTTFNRAPATPGLYNGLRCIRTSFPAGCASLR